MTRLRRRLSGGVVVIAVSVASTSLWFWFTPVGVNNYLNKVTFKLAIDSPELLSYLGMIDNTPLDFHSGKLADYTKEEEEKKKKMGPKIVGSGIGRFVTGSTANVNATKFMNSEEIEEEEEERRRKKAKATTTSAKRTGGFGKFKTR